jgi:hypothetical protein
VARDVHLLSCFIWKAFSNTSCRYYVNVTNYKVFEQYFRARH